MFTHIPTQNTFLKNWGGLSSSKIWLFLLIKTHPSITLRNQSSILSFFSFQVVLHYIVFLLRICFRQQISTPTPSCTFFSHLSPCEAPYSPYIHKTFCMSLIIYNTGTTVFVYFCNHTHSPHKISSIITSGNVPSVSHSDAIASLYFLKTDNVSGFLKTRCQGGIILITISLPGYCPMSHTSTSITLHPHIT